MASKIIKSDLSDLSCTVGIVVSQWNSLITDQLLDGALEVLESNGIKDDRVIVVECPGSYELPLTVRHLLPRVDGAIALGAVIRGDTPHFDYVCNAVNRGVLDLNLDSGKPVGFGVLTTDTVEQAQERADSESRKGNKGAEAALAVLEMISVIQQIENL